MTDQQETFTQKIMIDAQQTLGELDNLSEGIKEYKNAILQANKATEESFARIAEAMRRSAKTARDAALDQLQAKGPPSGLSIDEARKEITQAYQNSLKLITLSLREINQEQKMAAQSAKQFGGDATAAAIAYRQRIDEIKRALQQMASQNRISLQDAAKGMVISGQANVSQTNQALREMTKESQGAGGALSSLGSIGSFVFGSVLGLTAISVIRRLIGVLKEVSQAAIDFNAVLFRLEVAVNGLRRSGMDTTLEEWKNFIQDFKKEFPIFSEQEITYAVSQAQLMTREFGFTAEQIQDALKVATVIAIENNTSLTDSVRGVSYALSSGYFEALQKAGFAINRFNIGQELLKRGFEGGYNATDEQTRALVTLELIMEQLSDISPDIAKGQDELFGKQKQLTASWADARKELGERLAPVLMFLYEMLILLLDGITNMSENVPRLGAEIFAGFIGWVNAGALAVEAFHRALQGDPMSFEEFDRRLKQVQDRAREVALEMVGIEDRRILEPAEIGPGDEASDEAEKLERIVREMHEKIAEAEADGKQRRMDIIRDYDRDIEKIERDHARKLLDLWDNYQDKLADIGTKRLDDIAEAHRDYQLNVEEEQRRFNFRREEAERKYRENEIDAEAKFQERMRQLRENFLLSLEDAVRERDATQIMRLTRQYNLQRQQMIREEGINKDERTRQYQEEVRRIEQERQERMRSLALEHAERLREIDLQAQRERERAALEYERRKADEVARVAEQKEDRALRRDEQFADLDKDIQDRIDKIVAGLWKEQQVTAKQLDAIATLYEQTYGPGSRIDSAIKYYIALLAALAGASSPRFDEEIPKPKPKTRFDDEGFATGGAMVARKPTRALFGEREPELAVFIPLSKLASKQNVNAPAPTGARAEGGGKYRVEVALSPDLIGKVVDTTMDQVGDIIFSIERAKR